VVVDTNVLISALVGHGRPRRLVRELLLKDEVVSSPQLLAELFDVLSRGQFSDLDREQRRKFISILLKNVSVVTIKRLVKSVTIDPDDDVVLSTACEGRASHIVSGDRHLLAIGRFRGVRIISVSEMLELI
jgi:uncharacterized protein